MLWLQGHCRKEKGIWGLVQGDVYGSGLEVTYITCAHILLARTKQWPHLDARKAWGEHHSPWPGSPSPAIILAWEGSRNL